MIHVDQIAVQVGEFRLQEVSFTVGAGLSAVLMGPSGSGKTTLLEIIAGLIRPSSGRVVLWGDDATDWDPSIRNVGYVPQDGVLFGELTVRRHFSLGPRMRRWPSDRIESRINELARLLNVTHLLDRLPRQLSGGERQRVALGRAMSAEPKLLLLDEPLNALDDPARVELLDSLKRLRNRAEFTTLHVTHNRAEAAQLGDPLILMESLRPRSCGQVTQRLSISGETAKQ